MTAVEVRVSWQREGLRRKSRLFQSEAPARRHALILQGRMTEVHPDKDPDDYACCSGFECGCRGTTNAQRWEQEHAAFPPLVFGPVLHVREVGPWEPIAQ